MANVKKAIAKALVEGVITDLMLKTDTDNVVIVENDQETTLSAKLAEIITSLNGKATPSDISTALTSYVKKVDGKGLSTNDFTTELLNKLNGIAAGAQVNVIETVKVNGVAQTVTNKAVDISIPTGALASKDTVSESDLASDLKTKVNTSATNSHTHSNKTELDKIASGDKAKWDAAASNATTLVGTDTGKSARAIAAEETAKIVAGADTSFDTLKEIADWISTHKTDATAMNSAIAKLEAIVDGIGGDGEKATVVAYVQDAITALKIGDYAKAADLAALATRVETLEGETHTHSNKALLDTYDQTNANIKDAVSKKHSHANKAELDLIESGDKAKWDAKSTVFAQATQPANLAAGDLWFQILE